MHRITHRVEESDPQSIRIDRYLSEVLRLFTRSQIKSRLVQVLLNGKQVKTSKRIKTGDELEVCFEDSPPQDIIGEDIALRILFEDENVTVIDKPQGMVVHPAKGNYTGTLVNALLSRYEGLSREFGQEAFRPGIVHRLDKDTSGVMIVAKNHTAHAFLAEQFKGKRVSKLYLAILKGEVQQPSGRIESGIARDPHNRKRFTSFAEGGKPSCTLYRVLKVFPGYSFVAFVPKTGRTHQIRVHALSMGYPVLGDPIYSRRDKFFGELSLMLHAFRLSLRISSHESEPTTFRAPLPLRFKRVLRFLSGR
jgi:23S rRNA pseudouridine1911/1915/1917 synthase